MKYLLIAALVSLLFVFIYSRLRPYIQLFQKALTFLNNPVGPVSAGTTQRRAGDLENKLIRCDSCGTWVPANRAVRLSSGLASYCSRECLEKSADSKAEKLAG
ncbi:MAG TPA: hypothetical protein VKB46_00200 [Pyrinomonadaceae bacterium]|nr:hypothetical protein [Pyrinomonadaceae bacterium]